MAAKTGGGAGSKKHGKKRDSTKNKNYINNKTRAKNKIKRVLKASGREQALKYATIHGLAAYLTRISPSN